MVAVLLVAILLPEYQISLFSQALAITLAILGLNLVTGYGGLVSLGHGAFFGLGAYTTMILVTEHGWPFFATIPIAAVVGYVVGFAGGLPALRVRGHYLTLITLGYAVVFPVLVLRFSGLTGGANGLVNFFHWSLPQGTPVALNSTSVDFIIIAICVGVIALPLANLSTRAPVRVLKALRDDETGAVMSGAHSAMYKSVAFATSSMVTAVAGSLFVLSTGSVDPSSFDLLLSIQLLTGLLIGGSGSLYGCLLGGLAVVFLPSYTANWGGGLSANIVYGVILIGLMFVLPGGIVQLFRYAKTWAGGFTLKRS